MADDGLPPSDFAAFYRATVEPLRRYLSRIVGCRSEAQDLAQDAYVRTFTASKEDRLDEPQAYLYTTARHLAINRLKRRMLEPVNGRAATEVERAVSGAPGVERVVMARQEWANLEESLARLPAGCRAVLLLRKVEGLSHEDIAARLGISRSTVEKQQARALRLLREAMSEAEAPAPKSEPTPPRGVSAVA